MFVISNGSTKHHASSLAAAVLLSSLGVTLVGARPVSALPIADEANFKIAESVSAGTEASLSTGSPVETKSVEANSVEANSVELSDTVASSAISASSASSGSQPNAELVPALSGDILIHSHAVDGRQAATLYIKNIPVLTFIGTEVNSLSNASDALSLAASDATISLQASVSRAGDILNAEQENDPVLRATRLGSKIGSAETDATDISVRWNAESGGYVVTLAGTDLVALDARTLLPDTTDNPAEDALQVTNRLRRLLGNVQPVSEIEGRPQPELLVPAVETVAIVSSTIGGASWYGPGFNGRRSASGEVFNQNAMTAAHRTLPFGTRVRVTNLSNNRQVVVRINDRGPYSGSRVIDLSAGAAAEIGLINAGVGTVQLDVLGN